MKNIYGGFVFAIIAGISLATGNVFWIYPAWYMALSFLVIFIIDES